MSNKIIPQTKPQEIVKVSSSASTMKESIKFSKVNRVDADATTRLKAGLQLKAAKVNRGYN